ncbi:AAA family ATPase [Thermodesulfovibrio thiophilus]|uniref:AAA family ATPase n=1 Tax=Thermodesulfovibrio thiophilus TaxID=340095 RepID=UPI00041481BE|nr:AAA family ATPase [Thermodesulfovibrio thiophilus]
MKIKKIETINEFGQFYDFNWPGNLYEFEKYNFFYGWNYSGKTTLSRIFRCLELKKLHSDYQNARFRIETDNGTLTQEDLDTDYPIRVFNEDFIEDNFDWNNEDAEIEPVLILGKESKDLENELIKKQKEKEDKEEKKRNKEQQKEEKENKIQDKLTRKASEIREILSITNQKEFDKNTLEQKINEIKDNFSEKILPEEELHSQRSFISSQKLDKINTPPITLKLSQFIDDVKQILNKKVTAQKIIEKLKQNGSLNQWVREGLELHKEENTCQFCGNPLTPERIEELNKHFSQEFDSLISAIEGKKDELDKYAESIKEYSLPDEARFYKEFQEKYKELLESFNQKKEEYVSTIKKLTEELERKKNKPFDVLSSDQSIDNNIENEIDDLFEKIQDLIREHNDKVDSFDRKKEESKEKIKLHYTAEFIRDENYFSLKQDIEKLGKEIKDLKDSIEKDEDGINNIESKISGLAIGAERLNEYLNKFFNDDFLKIEKTDNGKYKLYRNGRIAKNLSTGERNIISLIYFFIKLEETNFDSRNAIVFIDDPVSSLDANHMHRVYSFLNSKIKTLGQLFITTHNFDFFNLLKDMYRYDLQNKEGNFYLIQKIKVNQNYSSSIEKLPDLLKKFKSEYNYIFYILNTFNKLADKSRFDQLYLLPNILRRFFEMYLFMKYPDGEKFKNKANKFFGDDDNNEKNMTLKIMDEYSHEQNPEHSLRFPDIQELITAVEFVLKSLESKDKEHYDSLCNSCNM